MGIALQALLNKAREARKAASHIRVARRKPDAQVTWYRNHRRVIASTTVFNRPDSAALKTRSLAPLSKSNSTTGQGCSILYTESLMQQFPKI